MNPLGRESWSPYAAGAAIGLLETFAMATVQRPLGVSTAFEKLAAAVIATVSPETVERFVDAGGEEPELDWETALVCGVFAGSAISASLSASTPPKRVPHVWRRAVGSSVGKRYSAALLGGALVTFGARMARGCTSGHGISGTMQLAASSWVFSPLIFATGAAVAHGIFRRRR